jgi:hypothetical protein
MRNRPTAVAVTGVVYEDNSWEGDQQFAQRTFTSRAFRAFAIENLELPILSAAGPGDAPGAAQKLRDAAARAQTSQNMYELNAVFWLNGLASRLERRRDQPSETVQGGLVLAVKEESEMLETLKTHIDYAWVAEQRGR